MGVKLKLFVLILALASVLSVETAEKAKKKPETEENSEDDGPFSKSYEEYLDQMNQQDEEDNYEPDRVYEEEPDFYPGNIYLGHAESFDEGFEESEIRNSVDFIEFKIKHVHELMSDCIKDQFAQDLLATVKKVKEYCVGLTFQILFQNYEEGLLKLKDIVVEFLRIKFEQLPEDYAEEADFFMDMIEDFIDKDLSLPQSMKITKRTSKYFVTELRYMKLLELAQEEIEAFDVVHKRIKAARDEIAKMLESEATQQQGYVGSLEKEADLIEKQQEEEKADEEPEQEEPEPEEEEENEEEELQPGQDDRDEIEQFLNEDEPFEESDDQHEKGGAEDDNEEGNASSSGKSENEAMEHGDETASETNAPEEGESTEGSGGQSSEENNDEGGETSSGGSEELRKLWRKSNPVKSSKVNIRKTQKTMNSKRHSKLITKKHFKSRSANYKARV